MSVNVFDEVKNNSNTELSILVVDDDQLNQRMMKLILSREGYEILIASNGVEAVELAKVHEFDIILMDLQMPVMDGIHASRQIREWENGGRHSFIVALTASYLPEKGQELFDAGIDNYISKPFDLEHLKQIIRYSHNRGKITPETASVESGGAFSSEMGLFKVGGSEDIYRELLSDFIEELPRRVETIRMCSSRNELEVLSRAAHNLKGVAANLGAMRLSERAGILEKQCDMGIQDEIAKTVAQVGIAADEFKKSALEYLSK